MNTEQQISSLEQLTLLQQELGYKQGDISTVALLGLIGEAGEVLNETAFVNLTIDALQEDRNRVIDFCERIDAHKKALRKDPGTKTQNIVFVSPDEFDAELADTFYYLNILAMNRGLTIEDLAKMGHDKVRAKQASGGSSEDRKTT